MEPKRGPGPSGGGTRLATVDPGLCATCRFAERVAGAASVFWLCGRSRSEPARFPRYPALPVRTCPGFEAFVQGQR